MKNPLRIRRTGSAVRFFSTLLKESLLGTRGDDSKEINFLPWILWSQFIISLTSLLRFSCTVSDNWLHQRRTLQASLFSNKTPQRCNIWVNSRVVSFCATNSPGHNADKCTVNNQRAARITLASVFTSTRHTSTDHVLSDSAVSGISTVTCCTGCDEYFDCVELWRKWATWSESSPATDYSKGTSSGFCGGQRNRLNSYSVGEWNRYLRRNT